MLQLRFAVCVMCGSTRLTGSSGSPSAANGGFASRTIAASLSSASTQVFVSNYLHDQAFVGKRLEISVPKGDFVVIANATGFKLYLLLCRQRHHSLSTRWRANFWLQAIMRDIYFYHAARSAESVIFRAELEQLAEITREFLSDFLF
jgi:hypothetical protein